MLDTVEQTNLSNLAQCSFDEIANAFPLDQHAQHCSLHGGPDGRSMQEVRHRWGASNLGGEEEIVEGGMTPPSAAGSTESVRVLRLCRGFQSPGEKRTFVSVDAVSTPWAKTATLAFLTLRMVPSGSRLMTCTERWHVKGI